MRSRAAIMWKTGQPWSVEEVDLDPPQAREVLVRLAASGLCHSDDHARTGDMPMALPVVGGHEGAGVVEEVGPGVYGGPARRSRRAVVHPELRPVSPRALPGTRTCATSGSS